MSKQEWIPTPGFKPELQYISGTGNHVMSQDPSYLAWLHEKEVCYNAEQERLVASARNKLTPEEFDAVQRESPYSDY